MVLVYEIDIQGDSDLDPVTPSKLEARKMTGNPSNTQKGKTLALCHAILPPSERCNRLPIKFYMERDLSHYIEKNRVDHTPLHPKREKGYIPPSFHHHFGRIWRSLHDRPQDTCVHASSITTKMKLATTYFQVF